MSSPREGRAGARAVGVLLVRENYREEGRADVASFRKGSSDRGDLVSRDKEKQV